VFISVTAVNDLRRAARPRFGNALSFNGTNSLVTMLNNDTLALTNGMTLEAWVQPTALSSSGWMSIVLKERTTSGLSYALFGNDGTPNPPESAGYARTIARSRCRRSSWIR
jgi:hypothetical protein